MYQVIARKYRPQTFDEVVGQEHVKQTLRNAIEQQRIAHGYIFSGPRGTGKTTLARILGMALNCEGGPSSSPDPESDVCREIAAGASLDVVEIDAASNRRIDDIRELRESVKFRPVRDRYKVFIIDEAHQITSDAFNALLKTLEEPPEWTVFVLCTTEPQAIPATITSRCQSFAFRAVELLEVLEHLRGICGREGIEAEDDALMAVALAGDGSIRDSLSTLDQAIAAFGKTLEAQPVRDLLGAIPSEVTERILAAIRDADSGAMLAVADQLFREGRHPQHFCGELTRQFRNLMVMKLAGTSSKLVVAGERERAAAENWLREFSSEDLTRYVQILLTLYQDLQSATQQRFRLEIGLLKLVYAGRLRPIEEVLAELPQGATPRAAPPSSAPADGKPSVPASAPVPARKAALEADLKQQLLQAIPQPEAPSLVEAIRECRVERCDRLVTFHCAEDRVAQLELQKPVLEAALVALVGGKPDVRLESGQPGPDKGSPVASSSPSGAASVRESAEDDLNRRALTDPAFLEFQKRLEGRVARVFDLRDKAS